MLFSWNTETIAWFKAASAYTGFHAKLADMLRPALVGCGTLYDMGCGLGLLSQQLYDSVREIVCVDISEAALTSLREDLTEKGIANVRPKLGDCFESEALCDVILLSYFGSRTVDLFLPRCRCLIAIVDMDESSSLAGSLLTGRKRKRQTAGNVEEQLQSKGIRYSLQEVTLEFGQPFRSEEDGLRFFREYYRCTPEQAKDYFTNGAVPATQPPYRYYLPYQKKMGLFIIEGYRV